MAFGYFQPVDPDAESLFDRVGGQATLERVHKVLYGKLFAHPVLGAFFRKTVRKHQESQQTDFMMHQLGGPSIYGGRVPRDAHMHLFITQEHFEIRQALLRESLIECGIDEEAREEWLRRDRKFERAIVKSSIEQCEKRYTMDEIIIAPDS